MRQMKDGLKIGELAEQCGVSRDTIRFYEREGLLPRPQRTASRYRVYDSAAADRLCFIRQAQALGLTLQDVRQLVRIETLRTGGECRRVADLLRERIETIDKRLAELTALRRKLARGFERCEKADGAACPVIQDLTSRRSSRKG